MPAQFRLEGDLVARVNQFGPKAKRAMVAAANYVAPQAESFMKENAKWTDRTGNARQGLHAQVVVAQNKVAIVLYHSVPYGVFLELRWGGKYAIIEPAMAYTGDAFVKAVARLLFHD
jgi:hypothetical protein